MARTKTPASTAPVSKPEDLSFAFLKVKADRVFFLLDLSSMPPEMKTAWVAMLPHMNLAQVDRLIELLQEEIEIALKAAAQYPEQEEFMVKLKAAKERYDFALATADAKTFATLQKIEHALPA